MTTYLHRTLIWCNCVPTVIYLIYFSFSKSRYFLSGLCCENIRKNLRNLISIFSLNIQSFRLINANKDQRYAHIKTPSYQFQVITKSFQLNFVCRQIRIQSMFEYFITKNFNIQWRFILYVGQFVPHNTNFSRTRLQVQLQFKKKLIKNWKIN